MEDHYTLIKGKVIDMETGTYLSSFPVKIVDNWCFDSLNRYCYLPYDDRFIMDTLYTNSLGEFENIYTGLAKNHDYYALVYNDTCGSYVYNIKQNETNDFLIEVDALGFLKINAKNDTTKYRGFSCTLYNYYYSTTIFLDSIVSDTSLEYRLFPGLCKITTVYFQYMVPDTLIFDSIYIPRRDTVYLNYIY